LLSCDPGRDEWNTVLGVFRNSSAPRDTGLYLYKYGEGPDARPAKLKWHPFQEHRDSFHPLGLDVHEPTNTLFVVNHAGHDQGPGIEWYQLDVDEGVARYVGGIRDREKVATPNAIAAVGENAFFFTNDHYFPMSKHPLLARAEMLGGWAGGSVGFLRRTWNQTGFTDEVTTLARVPNANGVALLNRTTLAVASSNTMTVQLYHIHHHHTTEEDDGTPELEFLRPIHVPFFVDNLSVDRRGILLMAGHPHSPSLDRVSRDNTCASAPRLSWVGEWSDDGTGFQTLYAGDDFGTSTTAVRDWSRGIGFVVGLYERGLMSWTFHA
jgi:hypothetical protein